jgi:hypothetical protein
MPTLEETLNRLAITFAVRDIMTRGANLVCGVDEVQAAGVSDDQS